MSYNNTISIIFQQTSLLRDSIYNLVNKVNSFLSSLETQQPPISAADTQHQITANEELLDNILFHIQTLSAKALELENLTKDLRTHLP